MNIGERIKKLRSLRGLTQNELSKRSGVWQGSISRLESGVSSSISADSATKLARELGVSIDYLTGSNDKVTLSTSSEYDPEVVTLIGLYSECDETKRQEILDFARFTRERSPH